MKIPLGFLEPVTKSSGRFTYTLFNAANSVKLISMYYATFLYSVFVHWYYKNVPECSIVFEVGLDTILTTDVLDALLQILSVWYNNVPFGFGVVVVVVIGLVIFLISCVLSHPVPM